MNDTISKFPLRNFKGKPTRFFRVERQDLGADAAVAAVKKPSHHILVVDRSGSMYGTIGDVKGTIEKLLTLTEFRDPSLRVSLITYSSQGDVKLHFQGVTVEQVMATNSPQLRELRSIQATSMTCISQGLALAETLINDADTTSITLHTDGYANDRSPTAEASAIKGVIEKLKKHPGVFVNTIAYGYYCDFNLLMSIANALSGTCVQARDIREVYTAIYNTTKLIAGSVSPAVEVSRGKASYVLFVSRSGGKVLGSADNILVQGLSASDDKTAYRLYEVTEAEYNALAAPVNGEDAPVEPVMAYSRAQIAEGRFNAAKYALVQTRNGSLIEQHARALVPSDIANFASGVEQALFSRSVYTPSAGYGLGSTGPSVLDILTYLDRNTAALSVHMPSLTSGYKRRGIKRIPGTRLADGSVEAPSVFSKNRDGDGWAKVNGFELNRNTATANMLVSQPMDIFASGSTTRIASVAGIPLDDLRSFNNYTLVGDGALNVASLVLRTSDQKVIDGLRAMGVEVFQPNSRDAAKAGEPFVVLLHTRPLVDYDLNVGAVSKGTVETLTGLTVLSKILNGMVKGDAAGLTPEQVAELKAHYLTPALNFSPPTTTSYAKLEDAIACGEVDTKLSFKVNLGTPAITGADKLRSGNEYLQRRFEATLNGAKVEKPTLDMIVTPGATFTVKKLTARTTLDEVDAVSMPIYEGILGLGSGTELKELLTHVGCTDPDLWIASLRGPDAKACVKDAIKFVDLAVERIYDTIRPLAFYVGATGMVPDTLNATAYTADDFAAKYPAAKLSKAEKEEGTFFVLPDETVLTVYMKAEHFSTAPAAA